MICTKVKKFSPFGRKYLEVHPQGDTENTKVLKIQDIRNIRYKILKIPRFVTNILDCHVSLNTKINDKVMKHRNKGLKRKMFNNKMF